MICGIYYGAGRESSRLRNSDPPFPAQVQIRFYTTWCRRDFLDRINWERYRVNSPKEYVGKKFNIIEAYELVNEAGLEYAFTGPDAVFFWTKGGYNIDRFFAFYPIHLKINKQELVSWKNFFKFKGKRVHVYGEPVKETLYGVFYVLYSESETRAEKVDGYSVMPLDETIEFCRKNIYAYEPALEMLDEMYNLKLSIRYQEKETNL